MKLRAHKTIAGMTVAIGAALTAQAAQAAPDLVIQASDSVIEFVGCEQNQPLARGRIVIRNEGSSDANLRSAEDFFRSFLAVYVPENIDLIDKDTKRSKVEPGEQRAITFSIGDGKVKKGRNYNALGASSGGTGGYPSGNDWLEKKNQSKYKEQIISLQGFLQSRGYGVGSAKPDGDFGSGSKRALENFQRNLGLKVTGTWTDETAKKVAGLSGGATKIVTENEKDAQGRTKVTIFAVVDPYNLIDEEEERNNMWVQTGYVKCD